MYLIIRSKLWQKKQCQKRRPKKNLKQLKSQKKNGIKIVKEKPMTKAEIITALAEINELPKKKIKEVLDSIHLLMGSHLAKGAVGKFVLPRLLKMYVVHKPATKPRLEVNRFTGEEMMFKGKPARMVVRIKPLKGLKEIV